jgi:hypothetical protein
MMSEFKIVSAIALTLAIASRWRLIWTDDNPSRCLALAKRFREFIDFDDRGE